MSDASNRVEARERLADTFEAKGPAYRNLAGSIRTGFDNIWVAAAIEAIASTVGRPLDEE